MPTSSELAQYRLLMQMQNQQNRIPFPTVTPTSGGAGVNFLQGLGGGLGYGIQRRQQGNSVEQLNQMMQAQAAAEQQAADAQRVRTQALYQQLGLNPALAGAPDEIQKTILSQYGQTLNADLQKPRLQPMLQQVMTDEQGNPIYDTSGAPVMVPTADARDILINTTLGRDPGAIQVPQQIAQAAGVGAAASDQKYQDTLRNLTALSSKLAKDKKGNYTPESLRTLQNAYGQAFGGGAPVTSADLQKETLSVQQADATLAGTKESNTGAKLGNTKAKLGISEIQNLQAREAQFQKDAADIRGRIDIAEPDKIRLLAARRTMYNLDNGVSVSDFFNTGEVDKSSGMAGFNTVTNEAKNQAMDAAKPQQPSFYQSAIAPALQSFTNWAKQDPGAKPQKPPMINVPGSYFSPQMLMGGQQGLNPQSFRQPPSFMLGR